MRERLEQENGVGKRTCSEGDNGENLSKVGYWSTIFPSNYFFCQRQLKKLKKQEMRALTKTTEGGVRIKTEFMVLQLAYFVS